MNNNVLPSEASIFEAIDNENILFFENIQHRGILSGVISRVFILQ